MLQASFFDGISSTPKSVELNFQGSELVFSYIDSIHQSITLRWRAPEVRHEKHSQGKFRKIIHQSNELVFLEIEGQDFAKLDHWLDQYSVENSKYALFLNRGLMIGLLLAALAFFPLLYFFGLPLLTNYAAENIPVKLEKQMGEEMAKSLLVGFEENKVKSAYADSLVACVAGDFRIPVKIHVVNSTELNAFALPGGQIFVFSALLEACKTKEELIALLGHEIGHVQLRHTTKSMMQSMIGSTLLSLVISDYNGVAGVATQQAAKLKDLGYSRELEKDADEYSITLLSKTQLNPHGIVNLFTIFEAEEEKQGTEIPQFLSSHPLTKERIKAAKKIIQKSNFTTTENPRMDYYFAKLKGL